MNFPNEVEEFLHSTNVFIVNGYSLNKPSVWILNTNNQHIKLRTDQLGNPDVFNNLHLQVFNTPAPYFKSRKLWYEFLKNLANKAQIVDITEYSKNIEAARQVIFYVYHSYTPETEPEDLDCLIDGENGFVYMPTMTIKSLAHEPFLKISIKVLRRILEDQGVKEKPELIEEVKIIDGQCVEVWKLNYKLIGEFAHGAKWC